MTPEHKALVAARAEVDAEHAKVNGDDGYNYAAGQEYGLRLALIVLDKHLAAIESLSAQCAQPQAGEAVAAHGYATRLLTSLMEKHYPDRSPEWAPLPDLYGVLTQIDNLSTGLVRASPQPANPAQVTDAMVNAAKRIRDLAMKQMVMARIPECGDFGAIAQDADWIFNSLTAAIGAGGQAVASESLTGQPYNPDDERFAKLLDSQWRAGRTAGWNECFAQYDEEL